MVLHWLYRWSVIDVIDDYLTHRNSEFRDCATSASLARFTGLRQIEGKRYSFARMNRFSWKSAQFAFEALDTWSANFISSSISLTQASFFWYSSCAQTQTQTYSHTHSVSLNPWNESSRSSTFEFVAWENDRKVERFNNAQCQSSRARLLPWQLREVM